MINRFRRPAVWPAVALVALLVACGGDKPEAKPAAADPVKVSADDYRAKQARFADSVLNSASTSKDVAAKLGTGYTVGPIRLRDSLALLTDKSDCYAQGRKSDPYLAGTVSFFVFMSVVGSNVVRVQDAQWTSAAGNIVNACLNLAAKNWAFDTTFGKSGSYITQVQLKSDYAKPVVKQ